MKKGNIYIIYMYTYNKLVEMIEVFYIECTVYYREKVAHNGFI